jgi:hypothetical protein
MMPFALAVAEATDPPPTDLDRIRSIRFDSMRPILIRCDVDWIDHSMFDVSGSKRSNAYFLFTLQSKQVCFITSTVE